MMRDDPDGAIARACQEMLRKLTRRMESDVAMAFGVTGEQLLGSDGTATTATIVQHKSDGLTVGKLEAMMKQARIKKAELDRTAITIIVIQGHQGPMLQASSPATGTRIECSYAQAVEIHKAWPLRLSEIVSADIAEFVPCGPFDRWVAITLPPPPFETGDSPWPE